MLPLGMPSKRGRGKAIAMPPTAATPKVQRMMTKDLIQLPKPQISSTIASPGQSLLNKLSIGIDLQKSREILQKAQAEAQQKSKKPTTPTPPVSVNYYKEISDHDYCTNVPDKVAKTCATDNDQVESESNSTIDLYPTLSFTQKQVLENNIIKTSKSVNSRSEKTNTAKPMCVNGVQNDTTGGKTSSSSSPVDTECDDEVINILEEISESDMNHLCEGDSATDDKFSKSGAKSSGKRNYRKQDMCPDAQEENGKYFDKIPAYYTTLSIRNKNGTASASKFTGRTKISLQDYFERNPSPTRDPSVYNKLPAYYSCYTNSTKYDTGSDPAQSSQENIPQCSSGYSSRSETPALVIDSRVGSRAASRSRSRSKSRSISRESIQRGRPRKKSFCRRSSYSSADSSSRSSSSSHSRSRYVRNTVFQSETLYMVAL